MIFFEPIFSSTLLFATVLVALGLWGFQFYYLISNKSKRAPLKIILNSFLYLLILGYVFQPAILREESREVTLIHPKNQHPSQDLINSLEVDRVIGVQDIDSKSKDVILYGQSYTNEELYKLPTNQINWIPHLDQEVISALSWEAVLQLGELQVVSGVISDTEPKEIRIEYFGEAVASAEVTDSFEFIFPVLTLGKNEYSLIIDDYQIGVIRFYVLSPEPTIFQLSFGFPNPEARFLTEYLVKRGEKANLKVQVTREGNIIMGNASAESEPEIFIIDQSQLQSQNIRQAKEKGEANFMLINLTNPLQEINAINSVFGTNFSLDKISEGTRDLENGVTALGYQFAEKNNQRLFLEKSVSVAYQGDFKVAVSLIDGTFPLAMAGDSSRYAKIWEPVLAELAPIPSIDYAISQPIYPTRKHEFEISVKDSLQDFLLFSDDTLFLQQNPVNPLNASGSLMTSKSGWVVLNDSIEIYVYDTQDFQTAYDMQLVSSFLRDRRSLVTADEAIMTLKFMPDWIWLVLFVLILSLIWLEPRV